MKNNAMPYPSPELSPKEGNQGKPAVKREEIRHPNQMDKGSGTKQAFENEGENEGQNKGENEGEGSRSAARDYDAATERYVKSGRVEHAAREAEEALEGPEGETLRKAELATAATKPGHDGAKRR